MNNPIKKGVVVSVILLFISVSVIPSTGNKVFFDDITPPVTTCTLNPPEPNGDNGWYVSDVEVTLNATDDMSGVNVTEYRIMGGTIYTYTEPFNVTDEGALTVEYRSIDYAGNVEDWKSVEFKIDQTKPYMDLTWEADKEDGIWYVTFTATCSDAASGMDRVEFYKNDILMCTDGEEPYEWNYPPFSTTSFVIGLIFNPQFSEENVTFFAVIVRISEYWNDDISDSYLYATAYDYAGNSETDEIYGSCYTPPGRYIFQQLTFSNNYIGYIGRFFIFADFMNE